MKLLRWLALALLILTPQAWAQAVNREAIIDSIVVAFAGPTLNANSPAFQALLAPAVKANPSVSADQWRSIDNEISPLLLKTMTAKGGLYDVVLRPALETMPDADLQRLAVVLTDPVYQKFQIAMNTTVTQRAMLQGLLGEMRTFLATTNTVLAEHKLNLVQMR